MTEQTIGRYTIVRRLSAARAGAVEVFEAIDSQLDRRVAVKIIHPPEDAPADFEERFRREARLVARLRDPNTVRVYDFGVDQGHLFLVMEYLEGGTLAGRLQAGQPVPPPEIADILAPLAAGLDAAHALGVLHRGLSPDNVLFTAEGQPVLTDFGLAGLLGEGTLAAPAGPGGCPAYMAPEQAAGRPATGRSDVYSLGVMLYQMATGRLPFTAEPAAALLLQHLADPPPPPRQFNASLPEPAAAVILKALSKDPAARFASAGELAAAFRDAETGAATAPVEAPAAEPSPRQPGTPPAPPRWLRGLAGAAEVSGSLIGRQGPILKEAPQDRRGLVATLLGAIGILLATMQFIAGAMDLVSRSVAVLGRLMAVLPYVVAALLLGAGGLSLYMARRAGGPQARRRAVSMFSLTLLVGLAWGGWTAYDRLRPVAGIVVLVGEFEGKTGRQVDFPRRIYEALKDEVIGSGAVTLRRTFQGYPDAEAARAAGERDRAALVIWGWYDDAGVSPHVELLRIPTLAREQVSIPLLLHSASAAGQGAAAPSQATLRSITRHVRKPAAMTDVDVFVKNGPQQMAYVSTVLLGMVYYVNGDADHALSFFDKAVANSPAGGGDIVGQEIAYFQRAALLYERNRMPEAIADLQRALQIRPDLYEAHYNLAIAYAMSCNPALQLGQAIEAAQAAARLRPDSAAAHRLLGDLYRQAGRPDQALVELQAAARLDPADATAQQMLASMYQAQGDTGLAQVAAAAAVAAARRSGSAAADPVSSRLALGDAYLAAGQYGQAVSEYQAAQKLAPSDPRADRALGNGYYWQGEYDQSARQYQNWAGLAPEDSSAHLLLGMLWQEQGKTAEGLGELQQAAALAACGAGEHLALAGLHIDLGDYTAAAGEYQAAARISPQDADVQYMLGVSRYMQADPVLPGQAPTAQSGQQLAGAAAALNAAVTIRPDFPEAHFAVGGVYKEQHEFGQAVTALQQAVRLRPGEPAYHASLADAYEKQQRWEEAAAAYQQALALKDDPSYRSFLGQVYEQLGRYDAAISEYGKAAALDPKDVLAYANLGNLYLRLGKPAEAVAALQQAVGIKDDPLLHWQLAGAYQQSGRPEQAATAYERTAELDKQNWQARASLGQLYVQMGRYQDAEARFQAALAINPAGADAHYGLAGLAYRRCDLSSAAQEAQAAVAAAPGLALYRGYLAALREAQGRGEEAAAIYTDLKAAPAADLIAHLLAGDYLLRTGSPGGRADAARQFQAVLEAPGTAGFVASVAHQALGQVYYGGDQRVAARAEFAAALADWPANAEAQTALGDLALAGGNVEGGLQAYDQAVTLLPEYGRLEGGEQASLAGAGLAWRRALALTRLNRAADAGQAWERALAQAEAVVAKAPQWPRARFGQALAYAAHGDQVQAETAFAAAVQRDQSLAMARSRAEAELARLRQGAAKSDP